MTIGKLKTVVHLAALEARRERIAAQRLDKEAWAALYLQKQIRGYNAKQQLHDTRQAVNRIAAARRGQARSRGPPGTPVLPLLLPALLLLP